jgi:hypothetical protein
MSKGGGQSPTGDMLLPLLEKNYQHAQNIANIPFTPYIGQLSPGVPTSLSNATLAATDVANFDARPVNAAQVASTASVNPMMGLNGIDAYMNPYIQNVIDTSMADIDRQRQMSLNQGASNAAISGAFGSDRHGVADALTNEAYGRIAGETAAGLRMGGFNTAAGLMQSDYERALQAALANQSVGASQNLQNATLQQQANLANQQAGFQAAQTNLAGAEALGELAGLQFGFEKMPLDAQYQEFLRMLNQPYLGQDVLNKALGMFGSMSGQWTPPSYPFGNAFAEALPGMLYNGPFNLPIK